MSFTRMGLLVNPAVPALAEPVARLSQAVAQGRGLQLHIVRASSIVISIRSSNSWSNNEWVPWSSAPTISSLLTANNSPN